MVEVLKAGLYDSIQDLGRFGLQQYGVPLSGVMDRYSAKLANAVLGNNPNDAIMEITILGPKLKFRENTTVCITGADFNAKLNTESVKVNLAFCVKKGDVLAFGSCRKGCRGYLAVSGGFQTEIIMNSKSMYANITEANKLKKGALLPIRSTEISKPESKASVVTPAIHFEAGDIEVIKGVEFNELSKKQQQDLCSTEFTVSKDSNRMAYQLEQRFENNLETIITSLVLPGTVQLTPSGQLLILMRDCQTTGGYPRVLQLTDSCIDSLAQKQPGQKFRFKCIQG